VYLQSDPDMPVPARVARIAAKGVKAQGRDMVTFEALLEVLSNDDRVKPGMTANVEIEVDRRDDAVTVPVEAVVHRKRKDLPDSVVAEFDKRQAGVNVSERVKQGQYIKVLYVMDDGVARVRLIDPGIADTRRVEIRQGIKLDDLVIIGPYRSLDQLEDNKKVALADDDKQQETGVDGDAEADEHHATEDEESKADGESSDHALAAGGSP
ncbi:MAG: hypothetical protein ACE5HE_13175, partial [Phycisphaerae bacterium]